MKLSDLKSGMILENEIGEMFIVLDDNLYRPDDGLMHHRISDSEGYNPVIVDWDEDFNIKEDGYEKFDIVKVYDSIQRRTFTGDLIKIYNQGNKASCLNLIWEREPKIIEVTIEEIAKLKGCSVEQIRIRD